MAFRYLGAGLVLALTLMATGCCCHRRTCAPPAVVGSAPVAVPAPDPCCGTRQPVPPAPAAVPAYSSPAVYGTGYDRK